MILLSNTTFQSTPPDSQNNAAGFPQQASIFFGGGFASHFGGFAQVTYTHSDDHFSMDNADLRIANHGKLFGTDAYYGLTLNNNPTVEDLWNSTPAWGFPWISSASTITPSASPLINGALATDVAGLGAYAFFKEHLYINATAYRSEHAGSSSPVTGEDQPFNIRGVAPYWRAAWEQDFHGNELEIGTYGIYARSYPDAISGATDRYLDTAVDFQFSHPFGANDMDLHGSYTRERNNLGATFAAEGADSPMHSLNAYKLDAIYHWRHRYSATAAGFATTGTSDSLLYPDDPLTGSLNGSPASTGYIAQFAYWPAPNLDLNLNYTGYTKFNGSSSNYDGADRKASDNNSLYVALWFSF